MPSERLSLPAWTAALGVLGLQFGRFAAVGVAATLVHVLVYSIAVALLDQAPQVGNTIGFAAGVNISYFGNRRWTFADRASASLARFWGVALFGFALNSLFVHLVTATLALAYYWAIPPIVAVTPVVTFALSRAWVFRR